MKQIVLEIPSTVDMDTEELRFILSMALYERGKLSLGDAAGFAGMTKRTFIELMGKFGFSPFNYSAEDLKKDFANVHSNS